MALRGEEGRRTWSQNERGGKNKTDFCCAKNMSRKLVLVSIAMESLHWENDLFY